jgi:Polyketide cyclase / dehydrase and lipid transport
MLKIIAAIAGVLVVAVAILLVYAATLPDHFRVVRTASIHASPEKIFPLINELKSFNQWNPFAQRDPTMVIAYNDAPDGKGAGYAWDSQGRAGKGSMEITDATAPSSVAMRLDLEKPMAAHNTILFALRPEGDATDVTWTMTGQYPYIGKVMGVVFNMDKVVGGEFEQGLASLKTLAEKG